MAVQVMLFLPGGRAAALGLSLLVGCSACLLMGAELVPCFKVTKA